MPRCLKGYAINPHSVAHVILVKGRIITFTRQIKAHNTCFSWHTRIYDIFFLPLLLVIAKLPLENFLVYFFAGANKT